MCRGEIPLDDIDIIGANLGDTVERIVDVIDGVAEEVEIGERLFHVVSVDDGGIDAVHFVDGTIYVIGDPDDFDVFDALLLCGRRRRGKV